jgi:hypothetical protein
VSAYCNLVARPVSDVPSYPSITAWGVGAVGVVHRLILSHLASVHCLPLPVQPLDPP